MNVIAYCIFYYKNKHVTSINLLNCSPILHMNRNNTQQRNTSPTWCMRVHYIQHVSSFIAAVAREQLFLRKKTY